MKIASDSVVPFARELVYRTYRDQLTDLVPHLPNIRAIDVRERVDEPPRVRLVNVWHGAGDIPAAARKLLSEDMLSWTDHASWDEASFTCDWRIETHAFTEAVSCQGTNRFVALDGDRTRVEIRGGLDSELSRVRGVPRFLAGTLGGTVEKFIVGHITPNLTRVSAALSTFLGEQRSK